MKKTILVTAVIALFVVAMSSCKTHEKCPAYTKMNKAPAEFSVKPV